MRSNDKLLHPMSYNVFKEKCKKTDFTKSVNLFSACVFRCIILNTNFNLG